MGRYLYQAKDQQGMMKTGQIDAADESDAKNKLKVKQLEVVRLVSVKAAAPSSNPFAFLMTKTVDQKDLQIYTRQFSTLINAGIPIVDSLKILGEGKRNEMLRDTTFKVRDAIEGGKRLGDAMSQHPLVFDRFYVNMVRAGEEGGILDAILQRLSTYMEKSQKLKQQVKGAMVYPSVIISVAVLVVAGILIFLIPKFQELYGSFGQDLPELTKIVIKLSNFFITKWYVVLLLMVGGPFMMFQYYRTASGKDQLDPLLIRVPLLGDLILKASIARMTRTLSTLLGAGVNVIEALEIAARTAGNVVIEETLVNSKEAVKSGKPLAQPLSKQRLLPEMVTQMIAIGEKSGTLDTMLGKIADFYEDEVETTVKSLTSVIEPILLVVLGGVIAFLVTAMYLPIFNMSSLLGK